MLGGARRVKIQLNMKEASNCIVLHKYEMTITSAMAYASQGSKTALTGAWQQPLAALTGAAAAAGSSQAWRQAPWQRLAATPRLLLAHSRAGSSLVSWRLRVLACRRCH
jgi:hypothetical protein